MNPYRRLLLSLVFAVVAVFAQPFVAWASPECNSDMECWPMCAQNCGGSGGSCWCEPDPWHLCAWSC